MYRCLELRRSMPFIRHTQSPLENGVSQIFGSDQILEPLFDPYIIIAIVPVAISLCDRYTLLGKYNGHRNFRVQTQSSCTHAYAMALHGIYLS